MAKQKRPKAGIKRGKPHQGEDTFNSTTLLEGSEDLDKLNGIFGVMDENDIQEIVSGSVGIDDW